MKLIYFTHSLTSCWNHGNAHFLRGVLRELIHAGHEVIAYEPENAWSLQHLLADHGAAGLEPFRNAYPELRSILYHQPADLDALLDGADAVIVHEWNAPELVALIGRHHKMQGHYTLLFHDTHHRAVSDENAITQFDLSNYDGVLAFGKTLADVYRRWGWGNRVFVWHEAADIRLFHPPTEEHERNGVVWIGNWGDGERTAEIESFLLKPTQEADLPLDIYGVRYPRNGLRLLRQYGATYNGWLANARAPAVFAKHMATVHVPRHFYVTYLRGIPTIRVFEALACGIPLVSAPWSDSEGLFSPGEDFLVAEDGWQMCQHLRALKNDPGFRSALSAKGLATIHARHTCAHRVAELLEILSSLAATECAPAMEAFS